MAYGVKFLLKIDTFWRHFSTGASIFNDRMVLFFNKFQLENDRAGHFSMGVYFQRYTCLKVDQRRLKDGLKMA